MNERRLLSVRRTAALLAVALVVGLLLAAQPLRAAAGDISSPALQGIALALTRPLAAVSGVLHIEGVRKWTLDAFRGDDAEAPPIAEAPTALAQDPGPPPGRPSPTSVPSSASPDVASSPGAGSAPSTTEGKPRFDAKHPLRVLVVGDSLVHEVALGLVRMSSDLPMKVEYRYKVSSGLVKPGFFDWPAELKRLVPQYKPDVTVMMYGNNDHQALTVDGKWAAIFSPEWLREYQRRVEAMGGIASTAGSEVVWIGMPIMHSDKFSDTARTFNKIYSGVCKEKGYWYVDAYKLFSDKAGKYSLYLPDSSGKLQPMRAGDGIHFTSAGGDRLARAIVKLLQRHYLMQS